MLCLKLSSTVAFCSLHNTQAVTYTQWMLNDYLLFDIGYSVVIVVSCGLKNRSYQPADHRSAHPTLKDILSQVDFAPKQTALKHGGLK